MALSWDVDFNDMNPQRIHRMVPENKAGGFLCRAEGKDLEQIEGTLRSS